MLIPIATSITGVAILPGLLTSVQIETLWARSCYRCHAILWTRTKNKRFYKTRDESINKGNFNLSFSNMKILSLNSQIRICILVYTPDPFHLLYDIFIYLIELNIVWMLILYYQSLYMLESILFCRCMSDKIRDRQTDAVSIRMQYFNKPINQQDSNDKSNARNGFWIITCIQLFMGRFSEPTPNPPTFQPNQNEISVCCTNPSYPDNSRPHDLINLYCCIVRYVQTSDYWTRCLR